MKGLNKIEYNRGSLIISSHIDGTLLPTVDTKQFHTIEFASPEKGVFPNAEDARHLNTFFKTNRQITLDVHRYYWMIPLFPEAEWFRLIHWDDEAIEMLKNNIVKGLTLYYSAEDSKKDLTALLPFGDSLEYLYLDAGQYKPYTGFEAMLNGMKKLKSLKVSSIKIDFSLVNENSVLEYLYYYGSKTKEWSGVTKFSRLKSLRFKNNIALSDIDFLSGLPCLETVDFMYCSKIARFPDMSHL